MDNTKDIGKFAALLSIIEIGLGSFLHSIKAPFTGQFLSLNQTLIITRASIKIPGKTSPALISNTAALLKSLSPAGKKLTPMLAISAQGNLYSFGLYILGNNLLGRLLGALLLSLWAYIQPLAIYMLLFGEDLVFMTKYFLGKINKAFSITPEEVLFYVIVLIGLKILMAFALVIGAHFMSDRHFSLYESWAKKQKIKKKTQSQTPFIGALKDLFNPLFIISIILMAIYFFYAKTQWSHALWMFMRPIAGGFIIFYILRVFPIEVFAKKIKSGKYKEVVLEALKILKS